MSRLLAAVTAVALLAGCAQSVWVRPGATQSDFAHDRAVCDYQSELGTPDINSYNGRGTVSDAIASGIADGIAEGLRKGTLMNKCMVANGWTLQRVEPAKLATSATPTGNPYAAGESEWLQGYNYATQVIGAKCSVPPGYSKNPAEWTAGCLAGEK
jgi:hypothetical protein